MKPNVGGIDRIGRFVIGIVLLIVGLLAPIGAMWQAVAFVLAAVAVVTAVVQYCPLNAIFGINTCKLQDKK
ncbi:MAG: DUF2892 domain-containing protein [Sideroxyarcus sp.]|nr:DUF2892 domain-containing protein [Sideroxyarcus sp.]